jgi:hypothetical protein
MVFFVWVCWRKIAHHTVGFGFVCFFGLHCFCFAVCVWDEGLCHLVIMGSMLGSVGVSVGYVGVSVSV